MEHYSAVKKKKKKKDKHLTHTTTEMNVTISARTMPDKGELWSALDTRGILSHEVTANTEISESWTLLPEEIQRSVPASLWTQRLSITDRYTTLFLSVFLFKDTACNRHC